MFIAAAAGVSAANDGITAEEIFAHADYFASDELKGRRAGQPGAERAASYIVQQLKQYGFEPLDETWELPFYVRGGATEGYGKINIGSVALDAPNLVQTPSYSPAGVVRASVATDLATDLTNKIAAFKIDEDLDEREQAAHAIRRGAVGVIFLRDEPYLAPTAPAHQIMFSSEKTIEELLPELSPETRRQTLESVRLDAPVIALSNNLQDYLIEHAKNGQDVTIEVRRSGIDASTNVAGVLVGADPVLRNEFVIVGAHYDHIGESNGSIYYGADDNASGTAAILEIAEALATMERRPDRSIAIIAWGAEELQLIGSKAFCRNPPVDLENVIAVVNLDMVGRNDPEMVHVKASSDELRSIAVEAAGRRGFSNTDEGDPRGLMSTDTGPFVKRSIPAVAFHTGLHSDYNTPRDTVDRLDIDKITRIAQTAFEVIVEVANAEKRPTFKPILPPAESD